MSNPPDHLSFVMRVGRILYAVMVETSTFFAILFVLLATMLSGVAFIGDPYPIPAHAWSYMLGLLFANYLVLQVVWMIRRAFDWRGLWRRND